MSCQCVFFFIAGRFFLYHQYHIGCSVTDLIYRASQLIEVYNSYQILLYIHYHNVE